MKENIKNYLNTYLKLFPEEKKDLVLLVEQVSGDLSCIDRKNFVGHVTASGLVLSEDKKVLVIFHNVLKRYLQPGGHIEKEDKNLVEAAQREVLEETSLQNCALDKWCVNNEAPFLIDTHHIPANPKKNEDAHFHHDFLFLFNTKETTIKLDESEVSDYRWVEIESLLNTDSALDRAAKRLLSASFNE
jgi:8-oxo-dGTP pyrophosphatase MutT (NUDIX family)